MDSLNDVDRATLKEKNNKVISMKSDEILDLTDEHYLISKQMEAINECMGFSVGSASDEAIRSMIMIQQEKNE